jgi:hypothetical protein
MNYYTPLRGNRKRKRPGTTLFDEVHGGSKSKTITGFTLTILLLVAMIGMFYLLGGFSIQNKPIVIKGDRNERVGDQQVLPRPMEKHRID